MLARREQVVCLYVCVVCVFVTRHLPFGRRSICRHLFTRLEIDFMRFDNISNTAEKKYNTYTQTDKHVYSCTYEYICMYVVCVCVLVLTCDCMCGRR